ncbi:carboxypeptidase regulatory-like domain-containing protein [Niabella hirudinis]|uniref:carboxypeptidase regulatory-like domain-containing protein n=1 Tax=Niabella hirudinis TaxID=1285929 RepID=UPI003EBFFF80
MPTDPTYQYTIEDIRRYLSGSMSPAAMHEMEKAALTDPFLADALDGYRQANPSATAAHLNEIRSLIMGQDVQKTSAPPVVTLYTPRSKWWRALAAAAVIGVMATGAWLFMKPGPAPAPIAKVKEPTAPVVAAPPAEAPSQDTAIQTSLANTAAVEKKENLRAGRKKDRVSEAPPIAPAAEENAVHTDDIAIAADIPVKDVPNLLQGALPPNAVAENGRMQIRGISTFRKMDSAVKRQQLLSNRWAGPIGAAAKARAITDKSGFMMAKNDEQSYYLGRVTDSAGAPIPGVTVTSPRNYSTLSGVDGSFRLPAAQDSAGNLAFMAPGYSPRVQQLLAGKTAGIRLTLSDAALDEVVVVGYGRQKKSAIIGSINSNKVDTLPYKESPYPQGGWDSFYNKLATEMGVNSSNASKDLHLRFTVENGLPEKFTVIKTPDDATAQKAISIIKKGPKWKTGKRKKKVDLKIKVD